MTAASSAAPSTVYTGRATNWPVVITSAVLLVPLFGLQIGAGAEDWWFTATVGAAFVAGVALYALTGASVRTTAGPNGVSIHFGPLGWPRCSYPLHRIGRAEVIELRPWFVAYGFWWTPRRTCCTVRSGPTLRLLLTDGRSVTVTTADPAAAVAALVEAQAGADGPPRGPQ